MKQMLKFGFLVVLLVAVSFVYKLFGGEINFVDRVFADAESGGGGGDGESGDETADACGNSGEEEDGGGGGGGGGSDGSDGSDGSCC